jgi:hypothetical protein
MTFALMAALTFTTGPSSGDDVGPFVRALWLIQRYGTAAAANPANDQRVKGVLFKALGKDGELTLSELQGFMEPETFAELAGLDGRIETHETEPPTGWKPVGSICRRLQARLNEMLYSPSTRKSSSAFITS